MRGLEAEERVALVKLGKGRVTCSGRNPGVLCLLMEQAGQLCNRAGWEVFRSELHGEPDA